MHDLLSAHPNTVDHLRALADCVEQCFGCAAACSACADACLAEDDPRKLARCIRTDLDCADICTATGRVLARQTEPDMEILARQVEALRVACRTCAEECEKHDHEHCRICADVCRRCERSCDELLEALPHATA